MTARRLRPFVARADPWAERIRQRAYWLLCLSAIPLALLARLSNQQEVVYQDVARWNDELGQDHGPAGILPLLAFFPEFRTVFYQRLLDGNPTGALAALVARRLWKGVPGADLGNAHAGPGLFLSHGQGTVLSAERIGANAFIHHGVTIGWDYRGHRLPILGDHVFIGAGAKILGPVTIGDGARIGANAVVLCDVPAGATATGNPARITPAGADQASKVPNPAR